MFELYLAEEKIEPEVVENMRSWPHSGFSMDQSVFLPAGDKPGIERLIQYMTRCPFSLSRLVKVTATGQVVSPEPPPRNRASQTWAMLIKRVYEVDPLACPKCGAEMAVVALIEPPPADVIEKILRHCNLWNPSSPRAPPAGDSVHAPDEPWELTYVDIDTFEASLWADF